MNDLEFIQKQMPFASLELNRRQTSQRMGNRISSLITRQGKNLLCGGTDNISVYKKTYILNKNKVTYGCDVVFNQSTFDWHVYEHRDAEHK